MIDAIKCPKCGGKTIIRTAQKGPEAGKKFFVCKKYPNCKGKVPVTQNNSTYVSNDQSQSMTINNKKLNASFQWYIAQLLAEKLPYYKKGLFKEKKVYDLPEVLSIATSAMFLGSALALANSKSGEEIMVCSSLTGKWRNEFSELIADLERRNNTVDNRNVTFEVFFPEVIEVMRNERHPNVVLKYEESITAIGQRVLVGIILGIIFPTTAFQMLKHWIHSTNEHNNSLNATGTKIDETPLLTSVEEAYNSAQSFYEIWKRNS